MDFAFAPAPISSLPIAGETARFPIRRIFCVGRNYAAHAREMGHDPDREPPFFFSKPADSVVDSGVAVPYPPQTQDFHYEAELVVAIGKAGVSIPVASALDHVFGYAIGNDLTRRDLQSKAKSMGRPWDLAKGFDRSAVIGPIHRAASLGDLTPSRISLWVNDVLRQDSTLDQMIWPVADVIAFLSASIELAPGDLIMTGTPEGVGALVPGDICEISIEGLGRITTQIIEPAL